MDIQTLCAGVDCSCGRRHTCDIQHVFIEEDALRHLETLCSPNTKILLIADENTYRAAGKKAEQYLTHCHIHRQIFPAEPLLIPDEQAIAAVENALGDTELILGVGSGVIQDLCKYVSFYAKIPYFIIATAPSMDGYASTGAAMITGGMKVTYPVRLPTAILADTLVLKDAPMEMIQAGYGDILGKFSALNDWKLSHAVNDEFFCSYIYDLTEEMLQKTLPLAEGLLARDAYSVQVLMEALVAVGIAMSFAGSSRPASGSEHHLSHCFEITGIVHQKPYLPHGIDVAFSAAITCALREKLLRHNFAAVRDIPSREQRKEALERVYGPVAEGCIALQDKLQTYDTDRTRIYLEKEDTIKKILAECPTEQELRRWLHRIKLEETLFDATYTKAEIADAVRWAKDLKDRYSVLWLYYDLFGTEPV